MLDKGFWAATNGYQLHKASDLKIDAVTFAKAAEKIEKILGYDVVTRGRWKEIYQNYEKWLQNATAQK